MQATTDIGAKRKSSTTLFMDGFFSVMAYPFVFDRPGSARRDGEERFVLGPPDIGRYFQIVGDRISAAYRREGEALGIEVRHE